MKDHTFGVKSLWEPFTWVIVSSLWAHTHRHLYSCIVSKYAVCSRFVMAWRLADTYACCKRWRFQCFWSRARLECHQLVFCTPAKTSTQLLTFFFSFLPLLTSVCLKTTDYAFAGTSTFTCCTFFFLTGFQWYEDIFNQLYIIYILYIPMTTYMP